MFDKSNEISVLKARIHNLELRKQRLLSGNHADSDSSYWVTSDVARIESQISEAKAELAQRESED